MIAIEASGEYTDCCGLYCIALTQIHPRNLTYLYKHPSVHTTKIVQMLSSPIVEANSDLTLMLQLYKAEIMMFFNPHETNIDIDLKLDENKSPRIFSIFYIHSLQNLRRMTLDQKKVDELNLIIEKSIDSYFADATEV